MMKVLVIDHQVLVEKAGGTFPIIIGQCIDRELCETIWSLEHLTGPHLRAARLQGEHIGWVADGGARTRITIIRPPVVLRLAGGKVMRKSRLVPASAMGGSRT